jgi:iodotyrosine deiodinase
MSTNTKLINGYPFTSYTHETYPPDEMISRSAAFYDWTEKRRTVRDFSDQSIPLEVIENIIKAASTAPSGAHKQPWTFCVVSDRGLKKEIRVAAENEEKESYDNRMSEEWLEDLKHLQTDWQKPFLEIAPLPDYCLQKSV